MTSREPGATEDGVTPVLGAALPRRAEPIAALRRGDSVGRYVILDWVGQGGMGVVYAGYDPELDRKVAIKLVRPELHSAESPAGLLREARAMARVRHPGVIAIHDIGVVDEQVFLAMEFIDGGTLAAWLRAAPRSWSAVLAMFVQAGRGLVQAHRVGVLHRDFKPDNVLVARDGRAIVTDFGLARPGASATPELEVSRSEARSTWRSPGTDAEADDADALPGTPPYMAPEQLAGRPADERSEQFSFCVALFEGLHGARPFAGASPEALAAAIAAGPAAPTRPLPAWLSRAVQRGLSPDPAQRWPSMQALLTALERGGPRRWPWAIAGALVIAGVAAAMWTPRAPVERCSGGELELANVWDLPRRRDVQRALAASGTGDRSASVAATLREVDRHAHAWTAARREACLATHARGEQSPQQLDRRMACFGEQLRALDDLLAAFEQPADDTLDRAASAVRRLPPPQRCTLGELESTADPDPLHDRLAALRTIDRLGQSARALPLAQALVDDAADRPALAIEARLLLGRAQLATGAQAAAERTLAETYWSAIAAGHDELAAQAALERSGAAPEGPDSEATRTWVRHAEAVVTRLGRDPQRLGKLAGILALVEDAGGDFAAAREHHERALELLARAGDVARGDAGTAHANYASALRQAGDNGAARAHHERALELFTASSGSDHPNTHSVRLNLAVQLSALGDEAAARPLLAQARSGLEQALGPRHPALALVWGTLGGLDYGQARYPEARSAFERAHALALAVHGPQHPQTILSRYNLGNTAEAQGDLVTARHHFEAALAATEALRGPNHPELVNRLTAVASVATAQRRFAAAREHLARALTIQEATLGRRTIDAAYIVIRQAELAEATGELTEARARYLEAAEVLRATGAVAKPTLDLLTEQLALLERRMKKRG